jgi:hypothetical protein
VFEAEVLQDKVVVAVWKVMRQTQEVTDFEHLR